MKKAIYLDSAATTPIHPLVLDAMQPYFSEKFGNSSSGLHAYGWDADSALQVARKLVAEKLGCSNSKEVIFTSGATESNNWAIRGIIDQLILNGEKQIHILSSQAEHNSVLKTLEFLPKIYPQVSVDFVELNQYGQVLLSSVEEKIKPTTKLMSFMWVNNELGSLNPILEIGKLAQKHQILFHSDATQAAGKIKIDFQSLPIDLLSFSAHKIYGPKGVGALLIKSSRPTVSISPLLLGGGQERGLRSGTANTAGIVGLTKALELMGQSREQEWARIAKLRTEFLELLPDYRLNGHPTESIPHILNLTLTQLKKLAQFSGFAFSQGSACHSGSGNMSHVLEALRFTEEQAQKTYRFSFGAETTLEHLLLLAETIKQNQQQGITECL